MTVKEAIQHLQSLPENQLEWKLCVYVPPEGLTEIHVIEAEEGDPAPEVTELLYREDRVVIFPVGLDQLT